MPNFGHLWWLLKRGWPSEGWIAICLLFLGSSKSNRGDDYDETEDKSDEYYHSRNRDYYEKRPKEPKKFVGRCFKCGVEGHKGTDCPGNDCPTKDEAADEQKTDKQSGKYGILFYKI